MKKSINFPVILTVLNLYAIDKYASKFQIFVTIAKLLSLAIIIVTGFWYLIVKGRFWCIDWFLFDAKISIFDRVTTVAELFIMVA